jgi:hypothetical protein
MNNKKTKLYLFCAIPKSSKEWHESLNNRFIYKLHSNISKSQKRSREGITMLYEERVSPAFLTAYAS